MIRVITPLKETVLVNPALVSVACMFNSDTLKRKCLRLYISGGGYVDVMNYSMNDWEALYYSNYHSEWMWPDDHTFTYESEIEPPEELSPLPDPPLFNKIIDKLSW